MKARRGPSEGAVPRPHVSDDARREDHAGDGRNVEAAFADLPARYRPIYDPNLSARAFLDVRDDDASGATGRKKGVLAALVNLILFDH